MEVEKNPNPAPTPSVKVNPDLDLVNKAKEGDQVAFGKLMARYKESVYYMILKMVHNRDDADDLTMVAFSKAFNNLANYSADFAFSTWLFRIATNNCIDFIRKKKLQTTSIDQSTPNDDGESVPIAVKDKAMTPEERIIKDQRAIKIREVIQELSPKYKQLIELRYFEELSYEEIAERCDLPLGTVKAQLFRAKDMLYNLMKSTKDRY
ncbi:MAG: sigma-70 family RNA polymerase sigma factor [Bacteroidetes bacterium]|nr:sigma-70 family RNA polymerase sigma factor [Bacteroidota bacterium]